MAVLETIRVKFGIVITALIAVALLSFIIDPTTLQSVLGSSQEENTVGEINGESVTYSEFANEVDRVSVASEMLSGVSSSNEQQQKMIKDNAWQSIINRKLFIKNAEKAGITVTEGELESIMSGEIESPVIMQNPIFMDENGIFNPEYVLQLIKLAETDARYSTLWNYLSDQAKLLQYQNKYMSLMTGSDYTNSLMKTSQIEENNNTFDIDFVMVPFGYGIDTSIVVSDQEIRDYYNSHKKFYKQVASRDIEYVSFVTKPSDEDVAAISKEMDEAYAEFVSTDDMQSFLNVNSERKFDEHWYKDGELNAVSTDLNKFVFSNNSGVSEIVKDNDSFLAVRIMNKAMVPDSVFVKVLPVTAADSLFNEVEAQWFAQTPGFEKLMTVAKGSDLVLNGYKFKVVDRTKPVSKKQVAILQKPIVPSSETIDNYYSQAVEFYSNASGSYDNFKKYADENGFYAQPVNNMLETAEILGSIENTKDVTRWAFEAGKGDVSEIITANGTDFIVAAVKGVHNEGYASIDEVSSKISSILYEEKAAQKKLAEVTEKIAGLESLEAIADALNTTVSSKEGVSFQYMTSPGLDPKLIGAASVAEIGNINTPIAGNIGVYVYKVTSRDTGAHYTEDDANLYNSQKSQYAAMSVLPTMMDAANVKDHRARYF